MAEEEDKVPFLREEYISELKRKIGEEIGFFDRHSTTFERCSGLVVWGYNDTETSFIPIKIIYSTGKAVEVYRLEFHEGKVFAYLIPPRNSRPTWFSFGELN